MTRPRFRAAVAFVALALIVPLGCSPVEPSQAFPAPAVEANGALPPTPTGVAEARFVLRANSTARLELLEQLAESEDFRLAGPTDGLGLATASIEAQSVAAVLTALLYDVPFSLHYRVKAAGSLVRLAEVELWPDEASSRGEVAFFEAGSDSDPSASASARVRGADVELAKRVGRSVPLTAHEIRERFELRRAHQELDRESALLDLESEDADVRYAALPFLDVERRDDVQRLSHLALDDPDPRVRLEAVEQLSFGDPAAAIAILHEAMLDSDEPVATTAKNELEHALGQLSED